MPHEAGELADALGGERHRLAQLRVGRLAPEPLLHLGPGVTQLGDQRPGGHRKADGPTLVGDRAAYRLANPPGGIGTESEAAGGVELPDRAEQAEIPFLDEVRQRQPAIHVTAGDADHEAEIGFDQGAPRRLAAADLPGEGVALGGAQLGHCGGIGELLLGQPPRRDRLSELHLLRVGQQHDPADLLEVGRQHVAHRVARAGGRLRRRNRKLRVLADHSADSPYGLAPSPTRQRRVAPPSGVDAVAPMTQECVAVRWQAGPNSTTPVTTTPDQPPTGQTWRATKGKLWSRSPIRVSASALAISTCRLTSASMAGAASARTWSRSSGGGSTGGSPRPLRARRVGGGSGMLKRSW